eukprot:1158427-Pelagomonas_calceolata.AAC.6
MSTKLEPAHITHNLLRLIQKQIPRQGNINWRALHEKRVASQACFKLRSGLVAGISSYAPAKLPSLADVIIPCSLLSLRDEHEDVIGSCCPQCVQADPGLGIWVACKGKT